MKCPICDKGNLNKEMIKVEHFGVYFGDYDGLKCDSCGESFLESEATEEVIQKAKEKGIFGIEARTKVAKSGNSLSIRIPKKIAEFLKLKKGKEIKMHPADKNKLIIEN